MNFCHLIILCGIMFSFGELGEEHVLCARPPLPPPPRLSVCHKVNFSGPNSSHNVCAFGACRTGQDSNENKNKQLNIAATITLEFKQIRSLCLSNKPWNFLLSYLWHKHGSFTIINRDRATKNRAGEPEKPEKETRI